MRKVLYLLARLSDDDIEWIVAAGERLRLPAGAVAPRKGEAALTFILSGAVSVTVDGKGEVARLAGGDMYAETPLMDERRPSSVATAIEPTLMLSIDREVLSKKIANDPAFAARLKSAIAMLRSARTSSSVSRRGPGGKPVPPEELGAEFMENVHLAGARFDRMLKQVMKVPLAVGDG